MRLCVFILDMNSLSSNSALSETRAKLCLLQIFILYSMGDNVTSDSEIG